MKVLGDWISSEKQVHHASVDRLLCQLNKSFCVPKSCKTLVNQTNYKIEQMDHGEYLHFADWFHNLSDYINLSEARPMSKFISAINLLVNIDVVPLFNALGVSKYSAYPILVKAIEAPDKVFCVGIFCTTSFKNKSMPSPDIFLEKFFSDILNLTLIIDNKTIPVYLRAFSCDAPVRASLKNIISHSGYSSCERCTIRP